MNLGKQVYEKMAQIKLLQLQPFFLYVYKSAKMNSIREDLKQFDYSMWQNINQPQTCL